MQYDPPRPWIASYAEGVPEDLDPVSGSLVDIVAASVRDYPDAPALQFFGRTTSYRSLDEQIQRAAAALHAHGVRAGDPVAIVLPNCPQHIVAFYAILRLGAVVVEHNPLYTPRELRKQFEDHGAKHAIVWSKVVRTVQEFPRDLRVDTLISVDITKAMPWTMQLALKLPIAKAREARTALTERVSGAVACRAPVTLHRRSRPDPIHERNDGQPQGRVADTSQPALERCPGAGVGSHDPARRRMRRLRRPADVPCVRTDAVSHVRDVNGRPPGSFPSLRSRHGARGHEEASGDLLAARTADR